MIAPDVSGRSLLDLLSLQGRVALVTGGARGIGEAIAARLAEAGAHVAIGDVRSDLGRETADRLAARTKTTFVELDVTSRASVERAVAAVTDELGEIDILVNNAGLLGASAALADIDEEVFDRVLQVNVRGAVNCSRAVSSRMMAQGRPGVIVNIASTASYRVPNPGTLVYTTSKHALNAVTKVLSVELGPHGIRVLDIAPTMVETPGLAELRARSAAASGGAARLGNPNAFADLPLGRSAVPDDVARVVAFVVSDAAALMTGSTIAVDAGSIVAR